MQHDKPTCNEQIAAGANLMLVHLHVLPSADCAGGTEAWGLRHFWRPIFDEGHSGGSLHGGR